jgi:hypothetical protein
MSAPIGPRKNAEWNIGAIQSLYSKWGTWFHRLVSFPAALCDLNGFIRFETEDDYLRCAGLNIGKETNVRQGISRLPGYVRMQK